MSASHPLPHPATLTILVVDDRSTSRELMARALGRDGYRVLEAPDGPTALELVRDRAPDLVLLDVMMPGMDGMEVLRRIRETHPWPRMAVVLLSALRTGPEDQVEGFDMGADGFIARPVDPRELTARIRAQLRSLYLARELESSEGQARELTSLLDQARDAIFVLDPDGVVLYWSGGAERLYGIPADEARGQPLETLVRPVVDDLGAAGDGPGARSMAMERLRERISASLASGSWQGELRQRTRDGRLITVEGRWSLVPGPSRELDRVVCVNTDVTERRRLFDAWSRAERFESLGMLAGGLAHDLNNALQPLTLAAESLLAVTEGNPEAAELARTVADQARRGAERVDRLLQLSRSLEGTRESVDLLPLLQEVIDEAGSEGDGRVTLNLEDGPWVSRVGGNPRLLRHLFSNLVRNGVEAIPPGASGSVRIRVEGVDRVEPPNSPFFHPTSASGVAVEVVDTGEGMAPEVLEKASEPLFTTREALGHMGLGLTVARRIARVHGGFIELTSTPGKGTRARVVLPRAEGEPSEAALAHSTGRSATTSPVRGAAPLPPPDRPVQPTSPAQDEPPPTGPHRAEAPSESPVILVVDDEPAIRMVTRKALANRGYTVRTAPDGAQALAIFRESTEPIGLVLVDMMMPGMDGPATIRALRELAPGVPVIGVSGLLSLPDGGEAGDEGPLVDRFLPKPFSISDLMEAVEAFLPR